MRMTPLDMSSRSSSFTSNASSLSDLTPTVTLTPSRHDHTAPLLSTVHMRHAMMRERIELRRREVEAQLLVEQPIYMSKEQVPLQIAMERREEKEQCATNAKEKMIPLGTKSSHPTSLLFPFVSSSPQSGRTTRQGESPDDLYDELIDRSYEDSIAEWKKSHLTPLFPENIYIEEEDRDNKDTRDPLAFLFSKPIADIRGASAAPLTPRRAYSNHLLQTLKNLVALLMQLDKTAMSSIRSCFIHNPHGLCLYDFLLIAQTYIHNCVGSAADIAALIEMFRDIDVNGDGVMEWDEFTSHLVQLASTYGVDSAPNQLPHFTPAATEDTSGHDRVCDYITYMPSLKRMVLFEHNSRRFKVYGLDLKIQRVVRGHRAPLMACCYWEKGSMLVTSSTDKTLCFWSHEHNYFNAQVSWNLPASYVTLRYAGGHTMFAADTNNSIIQWHLERAEERCVYRGHTDVVMDILVLPHYNLLASCSLDTTVRLWDVHTGVEVSMMKGHSKACLVLAYHSELKLLVSAGLDRFVLVWNPRVLAPVYTIHCASPLSHIVGLEVLPGSPELVIGDSRGCFVVYDLRSFTPIQQFSIPSVSLDQSLHSFTMIHSQGLLVAAGAKLYAFKRTTGVRGHAADDNAVRFAAFNPLRLTFLTVAADNLKIWNGLTGQLEREEKNFISSSITSVCLDDKQKRVYLGCHDGSVYSLNYSSGAIMSKLQPHSSEVSAVSYHRHSKSLLSGSWDSSLSIQDDKLSFVRKKNQAHNEDVLHIAVSEKYSLFATASADCSVCLHDDQLGPMLLQWSLEHLPSSITFLDPYPILIVADHLGNLILFHVQPPWNRMPLMTFSNVSRCPILPTTLHRAFTLTPKEVEKVVQALKVLNASPTGSSNTSCFIALANEVPSIALFEHFMPITNSTQSRSTAIMAMSFDPCSGYLYTVDDAGYVKGFNLNPSLLYVFKADAEELQVPEPTMASSYLTTKCTINGATTSVKQASLLTCDEDTLSLRKTNERGEHALSVAYSETLNCISGGSDVCANMLLIPDLVIRAHEDAACGLSLIPDSLPNPSLLTWSFDGAVHMWDNKNGIKVGSLKQSNNARHEGDNHSKDWKFLYNLDLHHRRELELMRDELKPPTELEPKITPTWLDEENSIDLSFTCEKRTLNTNVDKRMITPQRMQRAQNAEFLPAIVSSAKAVMQLERIPSSENRPSALSLSLAAVRTRPSTASLLHIGANYAELTENQTVAAQHLSRVIAGEPFTKRCKNKQRSEEFIAEPRTHSAFRSRHHSLRMQGNSL